MESFNHDPQPYYAPQQPPKKHRSRWLIGVVIVIVVGFMLCLGVVGLFSMNEKVNQANVKSSPTSFDGHQPATSPPKPNVKDAKPKPVTKIGDGTWQVGKDIEAGQYKTKGAQDSAVPMCYWDVRKGSEDGEFVAQGVKNGTSAQGVVTLKTGQWFNTSGCQEWVRSDDTREVTDSSWLGNKKVYVINHLPSGWPTSAAQDFIDRYTGSNWVMSNSCPSSAYRCVTVLRDDSLRAPVIGATYCYNCSRVTIRIDVAYANSRGNTTYNKRKNILAHEFGHAGFLHDHSPSCNNLMYAHTGCYGYDLNSSQRRILAAH